MQGAQDAKVVVRVRTQGRDGQGVVTAAELLSWAALSDGKQAQAFPSFGSEGWGCRSWPSVAFTNNSPVPARQ